MPEKTQEFEELNRRLREIKQSLDELKAEKLAKDWYTVEEFAKRVERESYTVREWCRRGRIKAQKQGYGRGRHEFWAISHQELLRYEREGLLVENLSRDEPFTVK